MEENNNYFEKLYIFLFMALLIVPWILWGLLRVSDVEAYNRLSDVSGENRQKNELDLVALISSGDELSSYINDRAPFRNIFIDKYQHFESSVEKNYRGFVGKVSSLFFKGQDESKEMADLSDMFSTSKNETIVLDEDPDTVIEHTHTFVEDVVVKPNCEEQGYTIYVCSECGKKQVEYFEATGHDKILLSVSEVSYTTYGYTEYICGECGKRIREDFEPKLIDTSFFAPVISKETILGRYDWLFYTGNASVSYYRGTNLLDEETLEARKNITEKLYKICNERGIELYIMIFPSKEQVYSEYMPSYTIEDEYKRVAREVDYINSDHENAILYPLKDLKAADAYWQVYSKYDTHWNHMGAFIGMQHLYKVMGMELTNPFNENVFKVVNTRDDLIILGGLSKEAFPEDYDYLVDYKPEITVNNLNVMSAVNRVTSNSENDKKLVFIADSYRELMAPFITKDFSEAVILHRDKTDACVQDILDTDVLFLAAAERYDSRLFSNMEKIIEIFESNEEINGEEN